jgi:ClpP class serine protease
MRQDRRQSGTLTGSIGVIMQLSNVEELMKKIGVRGVNVKSGANKDLGSPFQTLSPRAAKSFQSLVDNVHSQFVAAVAKGRGMKEAQVRKLADGRVFSGAQAKELGLVDQFGTLEDAVELAARTRRTGIRARGILFAPGARALVGTHFHGRFRPSIPRHRSRLATLRMVTGVAPVVKIFAVVREMI